MYFQHSMLIPQMGSDFPRKGCPNVHDWGQVGMFQGENGQGFRAFTKTTFLARLCEADPLIAQPFALIQDFATMLRERQGARLDVWLAQVEEQEISELKNFARGLQKDYDAVKAGLTRPWSQGAVEGHIHRLKLLKRQAYGRAEFDLSRHQVLARSA